MSKGIIYVMTTVVQGLVKIGKTGSSNFEQRMYQLENNGYKNVAGLKRYFAIEVEDYDEKEVLLDTIFSKSQVPGTELFALDVDLVVQLLSSFEGKQVYPKNEDKETVFEEASSNREKKSIPNGLYTLKRKIKRSKVEVKATMEVKNGQFILKKGSVIEMSETKGLSDSAQNLRKKIKVKDNILLEDCVCASMNEAASVAIGGSIDGWVSWKNDKGQLIDVYRK